VVDRGESPERHRRIEASVGYGTSRGQALKLLRYRWRRRSRWEPWLGHGRLQAEKDPQTHKPSLLGTETAGDLHNILLGPRALGLSGASTTTARCCRRDARFLRIACPTRAALSSSEGVPCGRAISAWGGAVLWAKQTEVVSLGHRNESP